MWFPVNFMIKTDTTLYEYQRVKSTIISSDGRKVGNHWTMTAGSQKAINLIFLIIDGGLADSVPR